MTAPAILLTLWTATWQAGLIAIATIAITAVTRDRLPPAWRAALWLVVAARLALPALPRSPVGLFRPAPAAASAVVRWPTLFVHAPSGETADPPPATAAPPPPTGRPIRSADVLLAAWVAGVATFAVGTAVVHARFARRVRRSATAPSAAVAAALLDAAAGRRLPAVITSAVAGPALYGVLRPRLLLPPDLDQTLRPAELRAVLRHELAHVRRLDPLVSAGWQLLRCVHWFNPLAWLAAAAWRAEAELAADAAAARVDVVDGEIETSLGRALLTLAAVGGRPAAVGIAAVGPRRQLRRRVVALAGRAAPPSRGRTAGAVLLLLAVGSAGLTATTAPTTRPDEPVTRTFDVASLFWGLQFGGRGEPPTANLVGPPAAAATTRAALNAHQVRTKERLLATLRDSVLPGEWDGTATLDDAGHALTVTARPSVLDHVAALLDRMRADVAAQVSVEAHVYTFGPAARLPFRLPDPAGSPVTLTAEQAHAVDVAVGADAGSAGFTAPRLTMFNHQRAVLVMETRRAYVAGPRPAGSTTAPTGSVPETGVTIDVRMAVDADRRTVDADLRVEYAKLLDLRTVQLPDRPDDTFQVPRMSTAVVDYHELLTGGTYAMFAADDREQTGRRYYVLLRTVVLNGRPTP